MATMVKLPFGRQNRRARNRNSPSRREDNSLVIDSISSVQYGKHCGFFLTGGPGNIPPGPTPPYGIIVDIAGLRMIDAEDVVF